MPRPPKTRQSLLIALATRSDDAWVEFLAVYEGAIHRFCCAMGLQDADARDATQEVLAAVHERIPTWDAAASEGSFRAWLFRVARNVSVDAIADRARGTSAKGGAQAERVLATLADPAESQASAFDRELKRSLLQWAAEQARAEVREDTWRAFHMTAVEGRSAERAAAELGLSVGSVYTAKCRVIARIRERIASLSDDFPIPPADSPLKPRP